MTTTSNVNSELFSILALRTGAAYHAAEIMRRNIGEVAMANAGDGSAEYGAIRLLIGTWEAIAARVLSNEPLKVPFYKENPVGHMWNALKPAIDIIRKEKMPVVVKGKIKLISPGKRYAGKFESLTKQYMIWLAQQPAAYQGPQLAGISAQFG